MENGVEVGDFLNVSVFVGLWMQHNGLFDLLAPGQLLLGVELVEEVLESIGLLLGLNVADQLNDASVALDLDHARRGFKQMHAEKQVVSWLLIIHALRWDIDADGSLSREMGEVDLTL